jgi:hypothetical protein
MYRNRVESSQTLQELKAPIFVHKSISDAVAISTAVNAAGLAKLFQSLQSLALDLLAEGFFVRGSIVKAPLYHDDRMVFGEGLVKAYYFESEVAKFPRIVVTQEVRNDVIGYVANSKGGDVYPRTELLRQSSDGPVYLDILQPVVSILKKRDHPYETLSTKENDEYRKYLIIKNKIQQRYEESMDNPRHFEKVRWFARYWNNAIPEKYLMRIRDADRNF